MSRAASSDKQLSEKVGRELASETLVAMLNTPDGASCLAVLQTAMLYLKRSPHQVAAASGFTVGLERGMGAMTNDNEPLIADDESITNVYSLDGYAIEHDSDLDELTVSSQDDILIVPITTHGLIDLGTALLALGRNLEGVN